ncbi:MAG: hypothetical protein KA369_10485 [Spirochaetes bacterium]|nr:hypothetical protein [Spirochaetota bacterium]
MDSANARNKQALLITGNSALGSHARSMLGKYRITVNTEYESLNSITVIKNSLKETQNTVFIRKSFTRLIKDWGPPAMLILDYRINLGPDSINDSDHRKLLRTFFISLVIMMKRNELGENSIAFVLITDQADFAEAAAFQKNPVSLLDIMKSDNEEVNTLIAGIKKDPAQFNRTFRIVPIQGDSFEASFEKTVIALSTGEEIEHSSERPEEKDSAPRQAQAAKKNSAEAPVAHIVFRVDDATVYCDGVPVGKDRIASFSSFSADQFYVVGRWEYKNQAEVAGQLSDSIVKGIGGRQFHKNDDVVINIGNLCTIDATIISSLVMLLTKSLSGFTRISIVVGYDNAAVLEKGSGYILIKKFIRHSY